MEFYFADTGSAKRLWRDAVVFIHYGAPEPGDGQQTRPYFRNLVNEKTLPPKSPILGVQTAPRRPTDPPEKVGLGAGRGRLDPQRFPGPVLYLLIFRLVYTGGARTLPRPLNHNF